MALVDKSTHRAQEEKFLALLRQVRTDAGLRQADVAKRLGVTQSVVSKYESGERRLDLLELRRLCEIVGVPLQEFVRRFERSLRDNCPR